jgi:GNAT superfamily N-acetyltransferase
MELPIRAATPADARLFGELRLAARTKRPDAPGAEWEAFLRECAGVFEAGFSEGSLCGWLAFDGELAVGTATLALVPTLPRYDRKSGPDGRWRDGRIRNVYVRPEYRRRGIAAALMRQAIAEAERMCVGRLSLGTSDLGRPLYEYLGFTPKTDEMVLGDDD